MFNRYNASSDVWSYGMVLYEIWSLGNRPFEDIPNQKVNPIHIPVHIFIYTIIRIGFSIDNHWLLPAPSTRLSKANLLHHGGMLEPRV